MSQRSLFGTSLFSRPIEADFARGWRLMCDHRELVALALGMFIRCAVYLGNRAFWMDEGSLWGNIEGKAILNFNKPLTSDQLAPIGFLIAQRALATAFGPSRYVARLIPLASGLAALVMFAWLARRILSRRAAFLALVLFAFSDDLIYYTVEMKPYSLDLVVGLAVVVATWGAMFGGARLRGDERPENLDCDSARSEPGSPEIAAEYSSTPIRARSAMLWAAGAVLAPWLSFPSAFVVAGCGVSLFLGCLHSRRYRDAAVWGAVGACWLASSLVSYRMSLALLSRHTTMYRFWWFAFLPVWPLSYENLTRAAGILLELFVNPLNLVCPFWPWAGVVIPLSLLIAGGVRLARRSPTAWAILVLPLALAMVASMMHRYPLHGRLILELVPAFFLLIAEGSQWLRDRDPGPRKLVYKALLVGLLAYPCFASLYHLVVNPPRQFNMHGDLHRNLFIHYGAGADNGSTSAIRRL
jgi:hypothetical protein